MQFIYFTSICDLLKVSNITFGKYQWNVECTTIFTQKASTADLSMQCNIAWRFSLFPDLLSEKIGQRVQYVNDKFQDIHIFSEIGLKYISHVLMQHIFHLPHVSHTLSHFDFCRINKSFEANKYCAFCVLNNLSLRSYICLNLNVLLLRIENGNQILINILNLNYFGTRNLKLFCFIHIIWVHLLKLLYPK